MVCLQCGAGTRVVNSRHQRRPNSVWRRRTCNRCNYVFTTHERQDYESSIVVRKVDGLLQPFSRDRLLLSLHKSLQHRPTAINDASALVNTIITRLLSEAQNSVLEYKSIINTTYIVLIRFDKAAATHYQAFHNS